MTPVTPANPDDPTSTNLSGFGALTTPERPPRPEPTLFDVCHVGVVLRATLFVHAALATGVLFVAPTMRGWALQFALGAGVALPAVLAWLISACALKAPLSRMSAAGQASVSAVLGAACGCAGWALAMQAGPGDLERIGPFAPTAAGAALALVMHQWLRMRALARTPADTTAQLAELQSRIRPHFLFNTLNSALALVRLDPQRAEHVLEDLAELFRVALTETGGSVTLDEEVELAKRYLAIEQIRFGSRLAVTWDLDPDAGSARMPPLLLQPLVENAVRHGIEPADDGGTIRVRTRAKGDRAVISIANSVTGMASRPGQGIALRNVQGRLRLMHDVNAQFESRRDGDAFRVQIVVPL